MVLPAPEGADEGDQLARLCRQIDVVKHILIALRIGETQIANLDSTLDITWIQLYRCPIWKLAGFVEKIEHAIQSGEVGLKRGGRRCERLDRT